MKYTYVFALLACFTPFQALATETLSLETVVEKAIENSPEIASILNRSADSEARAFELETLENPSAEVEVTTLEKNVSRSIGIELEQPMRLSNFGSRRAYALAMRKTASIEQKAQTLALIHAVTRSYAAYWALQEQENFLSKNVKYARQKKELIARAAKDGRVDTLDAKIFQAEVLRLEEQLRVLRSKKTNGAVNLLRLAGMNQMPFNAKQPANLAIPDLPTLIALVGNEASIRSLLESRKILADKRYVVAQEDASFPEFSPRAVVERDFDDNRTALLFGVNIKIPIWDQNNAELSRSIAERRLTQSHLNAFNEKNFEDILTAAYKQAQATQTSALTYQNKIVPSWNEVQSITDKKFKNGQVSVLELFQIRKRIAEVQNEALQAYLNATEAQIELETLIGQSLNKIKE